KFQSASVLERCTLLAARMFKATGAAGLSDELPFGAILADLLAARAHISNQHEHYGSNWGAVMFGLENKDLLVWSRAGLPNSRHPQKRQGACGTAAARVIHCPLTLCPRSWHDGENPTRERTVPCTRTSLFRSTSPTLTWPSPRSPPP